MPAPGSPCLTSCSLFRNILRTHTPALSHRPSPSTQMKLPWSPLHTASGTRSWTTFLPCPLRTPPRVPQSWASSTCPYIAALLWKEGLGSGLFSLCPRSLGDSIPMVALEAFSPRAPAQSVRALWPLPFLPYLQTSSRHSYTFHLPGQLPAPAAPIATAQAQALGVSLHTLSRLAELATSLPSPLLAICKRMARAGPRLTRQGCCSAVPGLWESEGYSGFSNRHTVLPNCPPTPTTHLLPPTP